MLLDWHIEIKQNAINKEVKNIICCKNCKEELLHRIFQDNSSGDEWLITTGRNWIVNHRHWGGGEEQAYMQSQKKLAS